MLSASTASGDEQRAGPGELLPVLVRADSANWKITTGRLAIGAFMSVLQNWLLSAVNSSGAVSPLMRATASRMPVTMPARAAR